jgi:hypothetical protein
MNLNKKFIFQFQKIRVLWYIFRHVLMAHGLLEGMHDKGAKRSVSGEEETELFRCFVTPRIQVMFWPLDQLIKMHQRTAN